MWLSDVFLIVFRQQVKLTWRRGRTYIRLYIQLKVHSLTVFGLFVGLIKNNNQIWPDFEFLLSHVSLSLSNKGSWEVKLPLPVNTEAKSCYKKKKRWPPYLHPSPKRCKNSLTWTNNVCVCAHVQVCVCVAPAGPEGAHLSVTVQSLHIEHRQAVTFTIIHHTARWQRGPSHADNLITITSVTSIMSDEIVLRNQTCRGHKGLLWRREGGLVMTFNRAQPAWPHTTPFKRGRLRSRWWRRWWWRFTAWNVFGITFTHAVKWRRG